MRKFPICFVIIYLLIILTGCGASTADSSNGGADMENTPTDGDEFENNYISMTTEITELESGFSAVRYDGDYLFGRNFDWQTCDALVAAAYPEKGYASISTVNLDFIRKGAGFAVNMLTDEMLSVAALYAPLDGMNEKGLCVSVNMIQDSDAIHQNTGKPDITTTTTIRLLLDQAATVQEALELLKQYDMHSSMEYMIHFAIADNDGNSVAVEYVDNEMIVTETPILTNFYLAAGEKNGVGTQQSHTRFEILMETLEENPSMTAQEVRDALDSVSKDNFGEFESTEWSVVFDQTDLTAAYYHRENYETGYSFQLLDTNHAGYTYW